jgi:hypothetical protein
VAAALAIGIVAVGIALPASAHHNTIAPTVACGAPNSGTWVVTWTVTNSEAGRAEVISASSDTAVVPLNTAIAAGGTFTAHETFSAPATKTLSLTGHWFKAGQYDVSSSASGTVTASMFPTNCSPVVIDKVCTDAGSLDVTNNAKPNLHTATVTLKAGFTSCDVSLNSYQTEGPDWASSGVQQFVDHDTVHLTKTSPSGTLTVNTRGCFQQQDLYIGTKKFDGTDGPLPRYPNGVFPTGLIDHWNGKVDANCVTVAQAAAAVSVTPPTCTAPATLNWGAITGATFSGTPNKTVGPLANYTVTATADATHLFATGAANVSADRKTQVFTGALAGATGYQKTDPNAPCYQVTPGDPLVTPQTCVAGVITSGSIWVDLNADLEYTITGPGGLVISPVVDATNPVPAGKYTVTVVAINGATLSGDSSWDLEVLASAGNCTVITPPKALPFSNLACNANGVGLINGSFTLPKTDGIQWLVDGVKSAPGTFTVTSAQVLKVTAEPASNAWGFAPGATTAWTLNFTTPLDCDLTTLAQLPTAAIATDQTCSAGTTNGGSITVGHIIDSTGEYDLFNSGVTYFIDGVKVTSQTTPKAPGSYHVTATVDDPADSLLGANEWFLTIGAAAQACGQLTTLPFTGVSGNPIGILLLALLLLIAGTGVYTASRLKPRAQR